MPYLVSNFSINTNSKQSSSPSKFPVAVKLYYEYKPTLAYYNSTYYNNVNERTYPSLVLITSANANFSPSSQIELNTLQKNTNLRVLSAYVDVPANTYFKIEIRHNYRYRERERYLAGFRGWRTVWHNRHSQSLNQATNTELFNLTVC